MADVFNTEVVTLKVSEGAAYGAALQALWCLQREQGNEASIADITDRFVQLNKAETAVPNPRNVAVYEELQAMQDELSAKLKGTFAAHRDFLNRKKRDGSQG